MDPRITAACALAAAGIALPAAAQNVTVFGRLDMAASWQSRQVVNGRVIGGSRWQLDSGGSNGSRIGFRGNETLGGGLKAFFVIESGFQADTGVFGQGGRAWGRQSYVGLEGHWGRVSFGRQYTPWFDVLSTADPFGNNLVGNSGNVAHANARVDNALLYTSPSFGGVSGQVMVSLGERNDSLKAGAQVDAALRYQNGPLWIGAVYAQQGSADELPAGSGRFQARTIARFGMVGASYDFGAVKVYGSAGRLSNMNPTIQPAPTPLAGARGAHWVWGVTVPVGTGQLIASVVGLDDKRAANRDARMVGVGYTYPLSRRTMLYGAYARIVNENGSVLTVNTPSYPGAGEAQAQAGISHAF